MPIRRWLTGLLLVLFSAVAGAQALDDAAIRKALTRIVDVQKKGVAVVVGIVDKNGPRVIAYGALDQGDPRPLDGDTVFEIGSITKTFTSLLLADMVRRREVALDDPISKYLPEGVKAPERGGRQITLIDLATHTSGLPRMPGNFMPGDPANPYVDYTEERMYAFLSHYELKRDIGSQFEYSNYGVGLLGHLLARRAGKDYETLLKERVLGPLEMTSTSITLSPAMKSRLAAGHRGDLSPAANWDLGVFAGAGGIRSTANDMLKYLAANLGLVKSPLSAAMVDMRKIRRPAGGPNAQVALSWIVPNAGNGQVFMHNGGTGGYRSDLGFDLEKGVGIVVLTNTANDVADPLGRRLLGLKAPPAPPQRKIAAVDPAVYEKYVGRYQLGQGFFIDITREGDALSAQATGQESFELQPESPTKFFSEEFPIQITFVTAGEGPAGELVIHQGGMDTRGKRFDPNAAPPAPRAEIKVAPEILDRYVGSYELAPMFFLDVTRDGGTLYVQVTAQAKYPVYAETEKRFFYKVVDAQIDFETDATGPATGLILHQGGKDMPAKKAP